MAKIKSTNLDTTVVTLINTTVSTGVANVVPGAVATAVSNIPVAANAAPRISSIQITDSNYAAIDDTAVSINGGFVIINGSGFVNGCSVLVNNTLASAVAFVNSTQLRVQLPASPAGTYVVYLLNPDGAVAIRVNGVSFSAMPTWTTANTLTQGVVSIPISIQLAATSNSAITYTLQSGSTLPAGLSLSSSGLLSGTVTGISVETTYNFTVVATDAELQDTPRAFSITITVGDSNFRNVTALLSATAPATTFVNDASANGFNITIAGDTRPSNFGPYSPGYYSGLFAGASSQAVTVATAANSNIGAIAGTRITYEYWFYCTTIQAITAWYVGIFGNFTAVAANGRISVGLRGSSATSPVEAYFLWTTSTSTTDIVVTTATVNQNSWNHVAVSIDATTASNSTIIIYLNGVGQTFTGKNLSTHTADPGIVYAVGGDYNYQNFTGYLSNFRVTRGATVYSGNFTPSTTPFTANANTVLLALQSNRFIDTSTNAYALTPSNGPQISGFAPYVLDANFAGRGSGFFDGGSDYLDTPTNAAFGFGTGDFTIEAWVYPTAVSTTNGYYPIDFRPVGTTVITRPTIYYGMGGGPLIYYVNGATRITGPTLVANQWYHVAVSRSGSNTRMFVNGSQVGSTYTTLDDMGATARPLIGNVGDAPASYNASVAGYISDVRVIKGTALYTANFTPPAAPLTAVANTSLLTLQNNQPTNNSMFLDASTTALNITRNGNSTQGSFSPYGGGWSNYFAAGSDSLSASSNSAFLFGSGDFTIECWINLSRVSGQSAIISAVWDGLTNSPQSWTFAIGTTGNLGFNINTASVGGNATIFAGTAGEIVNGVWYHVAVTRSGNTWRKFVNGVVAQTATNSSTLWAGTASFFIGTYQNRDAGDTNFNGYISNFRIVKGTAIYTSTFTPSTVPLTAIAGTSFLSCADNRFIDDSANNIAITRNGNTSIQRFNPFNPVISAPTTYSAYFDGTGDFLSLPNNSALNISSGDFTVECWFYVTNSANTQTLFWLGGNTASYSIIRFGIDTNALALYFGADSTSWAINQQGLGSVAAFTWYHAAVTRSGSSIRVFLNGTQVGSTITSSATFYAGSLYYLGALNFADGGFSTYRVLTGYISNARVVKGTALYTSNFTPSTTPLTAVANTSLLTCQSPTLVDTSTNNFTITANGDVTPQLFNPFGQSSTITAYTPAVYGGSVYFDGTGDFLTATHPSMSGSWTLELWWYAITVSSQQTIVSFNNGGVSGINIWCNGSAQLVIDDGATGQTAFSGTTFRAGQWNHVAVVRSGSTTTGYINGVRAGSNSFTPATVGFINIGRYNSSPFYFVTGYISDVRTVLGQTLYTGNFAPPVAPLTARQNTVLLANMAGAGIYDSAGMANYETLGDARINTAIKRYGNTSLSFDGTGDNLLIPYNPAFNISSGDWTIEFWVYFNVVTGNQTIYVPYNSATWGQIAIVINSGAPTTLRLYLGTAATTWDILNQGTIGTVAAGQWYHVAVTRSGSSFRSFFNGTIGATATSSASLFNITQSINIGYDPTIPGGYLNGYLADFRITRGVARYTAAFTPTTSPFLAR